MDSLSTLLPAPCGDGFGSTDPNLKGQWALCPPKYVPHVGMGLGRPTQTLRGTWALCPPYYLPHVGMGLGRPTQTLSSRMDSVSTLVPAPCADGFGSSDPNLEVQDGLRVHPKPSTP